MRIVFRAYDAKYAEIYATVRSKPGLLQAGELGEAFFLLCLVRGDLKYLIVAVSRHGRGRPSANKLARSLAFTNLFCIAQCRSLSRK